MDVAPRIRAGMCAPSSKGGGETAKVGECASGGAYAAGNLWGSFAGVGSGRGRVRAGKFFARSQANLDGTPPGRSVELADGAGKQGKRPSVGITIVPPRGEPVKVIAGRKFFQQGRPERAGDIAGE